MTEHMRRVVVTGMGIASSLGSCREEVLAALEGDRTTFRASPHLATHVECPILDEGADASLRRLEAWRHRRYLSRPARLAVLAGLRAVEDAAFVRVPEDMQLFGTASPTLDLDREQGLAAADPTALDALWLLRWLPNTALSALALLLQTHGEGVALNAACASSLSALGEAFCRIRAGFCDCALVAAGDSRLSRVGVLGYARAKVLGTGALPDKVERPFDRARTGFVAGEGGAAFVLESLGHARARGARVLAELLGFCAGMEAHSLTAPETDGVRAANTARRALVMAGLSPEDLAWVSTHGTGTQLNDEAELRELGLLFGKSTKWPWLCAVKSWIGHASSACGALECAICLCALERGRLPFVRNLENPLADLPFVRQNMVPDTGLATSPGLVQNFGFGGHNACLVLRAGPAQ